DAAVAGPPLRGAVGVDRPVLAVPDALQTRGVDALLDEEAHDRIGAALRQATIRLRPSLRIGVSLDAEVDLFGNLADDGGDVAQQLEAAPVDRVAVALEEGLLGDPHGAAVELGLEIGAPVFVAVAVVVFGAIGTLVAAVAAIGVRLGLPGGGHPGVTEL